MNPGAHRRQRPDCTTLCQVGIRTRAVLATILAPILATVASFATAQGLQGSDLELPRPEPVAKLTRDVPFAIKSAARFGYEVSLDGDRIAVSAPGLDYEGLSNAGAAFVFDRNPDSGQWDVTAQLLPDDATITDLFGLSISLSGDRVLVGTPADDNRGLESGSAYLFELDGVSWRQAAKLTASDGEAGDSFGRSVALLGDLAWVGAEGDDDRAENAGAVYQYELTDTGWTETAKLTAEVAASEGLFGADRTGVTTGTGGRRLEGTRVRTVRLGMGGNCLARPAGCGSGQVRPWAR